MASLHDPCPYTGKDSSTCLGHEGVDEIDDEHSKWHINQMAELGFLKMFQEYGQTWVKMTMVSVPKYELVDLAEKLVHREIGDIGYVVDKLHEWARGE